MASHLHMLNLTIATLTALFFFPLANVYSRAAGSGIVRWHRASAIATLASKVSAALLMASVLLASCCLFATPRDVGGSGKFP